MAADFSLAMLEPARQWTDFQTRHLHLANFHISVRIKKIKSFFSTWKEKQKRKKENCFSQHQVLPMQHYVQMALLLQLHGTQGLCLSHQATWAHGPQLPLPELQHLPGPFSTGSSQASKFFCKCTWEEDNKLCRDGPVKELDSELSWFKNWSDSLSSVAIWSVC